MPIQEKRIQYMFLFRGLKTISNDTEIMREIEIQQRIEQMALRSGKETSDCTQLGEALANIPIQEIQAHPHFSVPSGFAQCLEAKYILLLINKQI